MVARRATPASFAPPSPPRSEHVPRGRHWWVLVPWQVPQPGAFWRRRLFDELGAFRTDMHYAFDAEFELRRALAGEPPQDPARSRACGAGLPPRSKVKQPEAAAPGAAPLRRAAARRRCRRPSAAGFSSLRLIVGALARAPRLPGPSRAEAGGQTAGASSRAAQAPDPTPRPQAPPHGLARREVRANRGVALAAAFSVCAVVCRLLTSSAIGPHPVGLGTNGRAPTPRVGVVLHAKKPSCVRQTLVPAGANLVRVYAGSTDHRIRPIHLELRRSGHTINREPPRRLTRDGWTSPCGGARREGTTSSPAPSVPASNRWSWREGEAPTGGASR